MLIFIGPTAAGKTTLMRLLCKRLKHNNRRCICFTSEPFGGLAYIILVFLSKILLFIYRPGNEIRRKKLMAIIEILNLKLLSKLFLLIVFMDTLSTLVKHFIFTHFEKLGFDVLVEDYLPQMLSDHFVYSKLYNPRSRALKTILRVELKILLSLNKRRTGNIKCIFVNVDETVRIFREAARSGNVSNVLGPYNTVVRGLLLATMCKHLGFKIIHFHYSKNSSRNNRTETWKS